MADPCSVFKGCPALASGLTPFSAVKLPRRRFWHPTTRGASPPLRRASWPTARADRARRYIPRLSELQEFEAQNLPLIKHDLWLLILEFAPRHELGAPAMPQDVSPPMLGFQPNVIMTFVSFSQGGVGEEISKLVETIEFFHSRINGAHIKIYPSPNAKDSNIDAFKLKFPQLAQHVVRKTGADHRVLFKAIQHAYDDHPGQAAGCKKLVFACTPKRRPFYKQSLEKYNHKYNTAHGRYDYDIINVVDESDLPDPQPV